MLWNPKFLKHMNLCPSQAKRRTREVVRQILSTVTFHHSENQCRLNPGSSWMFFPYVTQQLVACSETQPQVHGKAQYLAWAEFSGRIYYPFIILE